VIDEAGAAQHCLIISGVNYGVKEIEEVVAKIARIPLKTFRKMIRLF